MNPTHLIPGQSAPNLSVSTLGHGTWTLAEQQPENLTMIIFYRGRHCPGCAKYLAELDPTVPQFTQAGVQVIAVSGDGEPQARSAQQDWNLNHLTIGYGLGIETARAWGLFISHGRRRLDNGEIEDFRHSEPGLYFIRPNGTVFLSSVQSSVFGRAPLSEMLQAAHFLRGKEISPPGAVVV